MSRRGPGAGGCIRAGVAEAVLPDEPRAAPAPVPLAAPGLATSLAPPHAERKTQTAPATWPRNTVDFIAGLPGAVSLGAGRTAAPRVGAGRTLGPTARSGGAAAGR